MLVWQRAKSQELPRHWVRRINLHNPSDVEFIPATPLIDDAHPSANTAIAATTRRTMGSSGRRT